MSIHQLAAATKILREVVAGNIPRGATQVVLDAMASCCALLVKLSETLRASDDPRVAAAHARLIETLHRYTVREQLRSAIHLESTAAHLLEDGELVAIAESRIDFNREARQHTGRAHYQNPAELSEHWLGLNHFEAANRMSDAHLLVARRLMDGSTAAPRFAALAELFANSPVLDPRLVAKTARALDKFEPADTCFEGLPLEPSARNAQGMLLETRAAGLLQEPDRSTRESKLSAMLSAERKARKQSRNPEPGIYPRGSVGDCDRYEVFVSGTQREEFRSAMAQADNPRTDAGKAARESNRDGTAGGGKPVSDDLFSSSEPMPPWAQGGDDGSGREESALSDLDPALGGDGDAPVPQRRLNALLAALKTRPAGEGRKTIAPRIGIHIQLDSLQDLEPAGKLSSTTDHGLALDAVDTAQLICQGEIYRVIFGPDGQPLDVGRQERFFTEAMKRAIFARDRGCIVPGCHAPPEMLEYHHAKWWERGGSTSVRNGTCLCRRHHHAIHAGLLSLVTVGGLAHILLPKHLDPLQIPQRNGLFAAA